MKLHSKLREKIHLFLTSKAAATRCFQQKRNAVKCHNAKWITLESGNAKSFCSQNYVNLKTGNWYWQIAKRSFMFAWKLSLMEKRRLRFRVWMPSWLLCWLHGFRFVYIKLIINPLSHFVLNSIRSESNSRVNNIFRGETKLGCRLKGIINYPDFKPQNPLSIFVAM